jgi:hypothetical protein
MIQLKYHLHEGGIKLFTKEFWKDAAERALKTFAQALISVFVVSGVTVLNADWTTAFATGGTAVLLSFLTSLVSGAKTATVDGEEPVRTASLLGEVAYKVNN